MNQFKDHFLGKVQARIHPGHDLPEMPAHRRHRQRRPHGLPPHVFRDAGQFQLRRLFQARGDPLGLGVSHRASNGSASTADRLIVSVYLDDDEAADIWANEIKLPPDRIKRMGEDDNFWPASAPSQGPDGVCGPCSEIFYHPDDRRRGRDLEPGLHAVQPRRRSAATTCARCRARTSTPAWAWSAPPRCCKASTPISTSTSCGRSSKRPAEVCGVKYDPASENGRRLRRIADHVRACTFAIHENVYPGTEQGEIRRQAAAAPGRARRPSDGRARAVPAQARAEGRRDDARALSRAGRNGRRASRRSSRRKRAISSSTIDAGLDRIERLFRRDASERPRDGRRATKRPTCTPRTAFRPSCSKRWPPSTTSPSTGKAFSAAMEQHGNDLRRRPTQGAVQDRPARSR